MCLFDMNNRPSIPIESYNGVIHYMLDLKGYQKKYLRGLAHGLKPSVLVGHKGITSALTQAIAEEFDHHELIKIKFIDYKEPSQKQELSTLIEDASDSLLVGAIGHTAIFYKQHPDPEKRKIIIPKRPSEQTE